MSDPPEDALSAEILSAYAGRWIARIGNRVVGQGGTPQQALASAQSARFKEVPQVTYVPLQNTDLFSQHLDPILDVLPIGAEIYLVGGTVRDWLLGLATHDWDFAVPGDVFQVARRAADKLGAAFFPLDNERKTARLVLTRPDGSRTTYDFAALRGANLEADLRSRDFTINAMAIDIRQPQALLDPLSGAVDLRYKTLRACSPSAISDDPVRLLRAIRLAAAYNLHILPETRSLLRQAVPSLPRVSPERVRDEFFRILSGSQPDACLRALEMLGVFAGLMPELTALKGVEQSPPHTMDVWGHTLGVVQKLEVVASALSPGYKSDESTNLLVGLAVLKLGKYRQQIGQHLGELLNPDRSVRGLLFFSALFHDIGKPATRKVDEDGSIHFFSHEKIGEEIAAERAQALRLSNQEVDRVRVAIRGHLRPLWLAGTGALPTRKALYRFFRDTGPAGVDICLLSLADVLATYGPGLPVDLWENHLEVVRLLLEAWWDRPEEVVFPPALLNGRELMETFQLEPGPVIGQLLEAIKEAQAAGEISRQIEAIDLARRLLAEWSSQEE